MKLSHLKQICAYLKKCKKIVTAYRVDDNLVKVVFDKDETVYFDLQKGSSKIFKTKEELTRTKIYNAPFDIMLAKRFARSVIEKIELVGGDKLLRITASLSMSYKKQTTHLQFEFTGKHTNVILLESDETVLEALRHIDLFSSFREVRTGQKLLPLPKQNFTPKEYPLENVEEFLYEEYEREYAQKLTRLKKQKTAFLEKKLTKLKQSYNKLANENELLQKANELELLGNLTLMQLHSIQPYQRELLLYDYEGQEKKVVLEKLFAKPSDIVEYFFTKAKKAKQKAKNLHIEKESLKSKITYTQNFIEAVKSAKSTAKIDMLFPKQQKSKQKKRDDAIESFFIEGYRVRLGKNQKGNVELLQNAKAKDIWLHLKDRPSCHVIIATDKQNVPKNVLYEAAKLCVEFTTPIKDRYLVDYTKRREVKIQEGANVLYYNYDTIEVDTRD